MLSFKRFFFCIIWIAMFYQMCFLQLFSPSLWLIFSFSWHCLSQSINYFILIKSSLWIISFLDLFFDVVSQKTLPYSKPSRFSPMLFSKRFIALHVVFRSMIHSELMLLKGARSGSTFIVLSADVQLSQNNLLKRPSLLH